MDNKYMLTLVPVNCMNFGRSACAFLFYSNRSVARFLYTLGVVTFARPAVVEDWGKWGQPRYY